MCFCSVGIWCGHGRADQISACVCVPHGEDTGWMRQVSVCLSGLSAERASMPWPQEHRASGS